MREVTRVKAAELFPLISELIQQGQSARLVVSGSSMYPFLRDGIDSVELVKGNFDDLKRGDIVMIQRLDGTYVMHRIIKKDKDSFVMVGDAQEWLEGPISREQMVAVVTAIWRKEEKISCSSTGWKLLSELWLILLPFRYFILRVFNKLSRIKHRLLAKKTK
ncbi:MAG: S24/S26 family peptidase [Candidatus Saccharibacteria bacterium]